MHNENWMTDADEASQNKRGFLLAHGTPDHVRKIIGAVRDPHLLRARISMALHNPAVPHDVLETAWNNGYSRIEIAAHPNVPDHIHQAALKFDNPQVQIAALANPKTRRSHVEDRWENSKYPEVREHASILRSSERIMMGDD